MTLDMCVFNAVCANSTKVTTAQAQEAISSLCGSSQKTALVQVISAFEVPKLRYDPIRKVFFQVGGTPSLHGSAEVCLIFLMHTLLCHLAVSQFPSCGPLDGYFIEVFVRVSMVELVFPVTLEANIR